LRDYKNRALTGEWFRKTLKRSELAAALAIVLRLRDFKEQRALYSKCGEIDEMSTGCQNRNGHYERRSRSMAQTVNGAAIRKE